ADAHHLVLNWARALRGETSAPLSLSDEEFDENIYLSAYGDNPFFSIFYYTARMNVAYILEDFAQALDAATKARRIAHHLSGTIWPVLVDFWGGLTMAANYAQATEDERRTYLEEMKKAQSSLAVLGRNCPENFLCFSLLLSAEIERVIDPAGGRELSAQDFYERAIRYAEETRMIQHQALANELYARFWLRRGREAVAAVFLAEARAYYAQWGATAKVEEMDRRYAGSLERRLRYSSEGSA